MGRALGEAPPDGLRPAEGRALGLEVDGRLPVDADVGRVLPDAGRLVDGAGRVPELGAGLGRGVAVGAGRGLGVGRGVARGAGFGDGFGREVGLDDEVDAADAARIG